MDYSDGARRSPAHTRGYRRQRLGFCPLLKLLQDGDGAWPKRYIASAIFGVRKRQHWKPLAVQNERLHQYLAQSPVLRALYFAKQQLNGFLVMMWSLQPHRRGAGDQTELYNVDRVSKSEGLDGLPSDYSKLPKKVPELGPPLPGDLGPAIVKAQQPVAPTYTPPGHDPDDALRKEAEAAAASSVFFS